MATNPFQSTSQQASNDDSSRAAYNEEMQQEQRIERRREVERERERYVPRGYPEEEEEETHWMHRPILRHRGVLDRLHPSNFRIEREDLPDFCSAGLVHKNTLILDHDDLPDFAAPIHNGGFRDYQGIGGKLGLMDNLPNFSSPIFREKIINMPRFGSIVQGKRKTGKMMRKGRRGRVPRGEFDLDIDFSRGIL
jgi:hypothetical protein